MHQEVNAAVSFILNILRLKRRWVPEQLEAMREKLQWCLCDRYRGHWYPEQPYRGQAYRCIRINASQPPDTSLLAACTQCGIDYMTLRLPEELTLWIDPYEVCGRYTENSKCFTIVKFPKMPKPDPTSTSDYSSGSGSSASVSESSSDDELLVKDQKPKMASPSCNKTPNPVPPNEVSLNLDIFWETFFDSSDQDCSLEDSRLLTVWKNVKAPTAVVEEDSVFV